MIKYEIIAVLEGDYLCDHAKAVIEAARADYQETFGGASADRRQG